MRAMFDVGYLVNIFVAVVVIASDASCDAAVAFDPVFKNVVIVVCIGEVIAVTGVFAAVLDAVVAVTILMDVVTSVCF